MDMCPKSIVQVARAKKISEDSEVLELLRRLCKGFKTSLSDNVLDMLIKKDYRGVIGLYSEVKPENYTDPNLFFQDRALVSFLAKYPFKSVTSQKEREQRALKSVADAEIRCRETNMRFHSGKLPMDVQSLILAARRKISLVLGSVNIAEVLRNCRWGPGTTLSISEPTRTAFFFKLTSGVSTTAKLRPFADSFLVDFPGWSLALGQGHVLSSLKGYPLMDADSPFEIVDHNRITTVPKTALSERPIAVEPHLNQFLQLGIGGAIRDRLKRVGIDIRRAQAKHRELARFASIYPSILATLDLSSASDTIAYRVVEELLPSDWFYLLNLARSDYGLFPDGTTVKYEKFSSMGNGYTFELETLIFWAICASVNDIYGSGNQTIAVYGDDMIVPTEIAEKLSYFLDNFGFVVNKSKSYCSPAHHFRESCGGDYFLGRDVRPIFLTSELDNALRIIELANRLRWSHTANNLSIRCGCSYRYLGLHLLDWLPNDFKRSIASLPGRHGWATQRTEDENYVRESDYYFDTSDNLDQNLGFLWVTPEWFVEDDFYYDNDLQSIVLKGRFCLNEQAMYVGTSSNPSAQLIAGAEGTLLNGRVALRDVTRIGCRRKASAVLEKY